MKFALFALLAAATSAVRVSQTELTPEDPWLVETTAEAELGNWVTKAIFAHYAGADGKMTEAEALKFFYKVWKSDNNRKNAFAMCKKHGINRKDCWKLIKKTF